MMKIVGAIRAIYTKVLTPNTIEVDRLGQGVVVRVMNKVGATHDQMSICSRDDRHDQYIKNDGKAGVTISVVHSQCGTTTIHSFDERLIKTIADELDKMPAMGHCDDQEVS